MQEVWVQSLVGELKSHMLCGAAKKKKKKKYKKDSHLPIKSDLYFVSFHSAVPIQKYVLIVFLVYTSLK